MQSPKRKAIIVQTMFRISWFESLVGFLFCCPFTYSTHSYVSSASVSSHRARLSLITAVAGSRRCLERSDHTSV
eukprot:474837-Amphidinium_carterae.1